MEVEDEEEGGAAAVVDDAAVAAAPADEPVAAVAVVVVPADPVAAAISGAVGAVPSPLLLSMGVGGTSKCPLRSFVSNFLTVSSAFFASASTCSLSDATRLERSFAHNRRHAWCAFSSLSIASRS